MVLKVEASDVFFLLILADCMFVVCFFVWLVRVSVTTLYKGCTGRPTLPGSICAIATRFAVPSSTVSRAWRRFQETDSYSKRPGQSCRRSISHEHD